MRINKSNVRRTSNRRAHRPDQRVYRTMRLRGVGGERRRARLRVIAAVVLGVAIAGLALWLFRRG